MCSSLSVIPEAGLRSAFNYFSSSPPLALILPSRLPEDSPALRQSTGLCGSAFFVFWAQTLSIKINLFGAADGLGCSELGQFR